MGTNGNETDIGTSSRSSGTREKGRWTFAKYDKGLSVLEQYDLVSEHTYRGRGTLLCQTRQGLKMIKPYIGSCSKLEKINYVLEVLKKKGHTDLDFILRNKDGELVSVDKDGYSYLVKNWKEGRECDVRSEKDITLCMELLACVHKDLYGTIESGCEQENLLSEYEKHNQQLKKIRFYIRSRKQKNAFEYLYLSSVERYMRYGEDVCLRLQETGYQNLRMQDIQKGSICHGMCNQHNFMMTDGGVHIVNFDHFFIGNHMADVAQFLRKIMEKHNWNIELAHKMLFVYDQVLPISKEQWEQLSIRMAYPEKYWKIANYYYNNNKAFLPEKNLDKLRSFISQENKWLEFLKKVFG